MTKVTETFLDFCDFYFCYTLGLTIAVNHKVFEILFGTGNPSPTILKSATYKNCVADPTFCTLNSALNYNFPDFIM